MKLLLIRHGESEADILKVHEGAADFALTPRGRAQVKAMAAGVAGQYGITKLYSSPLRRARETANALSAVTGLLPSLEEELREFYNGKLGGLDYATASEAYPKPAVLAPHQSAYKQESMLEFRFRAERLLSRVLCENPDDATIAIVSHGGMINQLLQAFLRLPIECGAAFATADAGVHVLEVKNGLRLVLKANDTSLVQALSSIDSAQPSACAGK